jgi:hypothetical protein
VLLINSSSAITEEFSVLFLAVAPLPFDKYVIVAIYLLVYMNIAKARIIDFLYKIIAVRETLDKILLELC